MPVSKKSFLKQMEKSGYSARYVLSVFEFTGKDTAIVHIKDEQALYQLIELHPFSDQPSSRINAAIGGHSHDVAVDGSLIILRSINHPHPVVIVNDSDGTSIPRPLMPQALVIENLQNFLHLETSLEFVAQHTDLNPLLTEVIWSNGNAINNKLNSRFLTSFKRTLWLVDCDLGGIQILANAMNYLPEKLMEIVVPTDLEQRLKDHGGKLSPEDRERLFTLAQKHARLTYLAEPLMRLHRQLEQETYLISKERI